MKSWSLYFQPALWAAKKALKNVHQIPSWRDRPWGYPKGPHQQRPQRLAPAGSARLFPFLSQAVQQLRSRQPPVHPRGVPGVGLRGEVPAGQTPSPCSALALLSTAGRPPRSDEKSGRVAPGGRGATWSAQNCGKGQDIQDHDHIKTKGPGITSKNT